MATKSKSKAKWPMLKKGSVGVKVRLLQHALAEQGFDPGSVDGDFGEHTDAALRNFQASEGMLADGKAGPKTITALGLGEPSTRSLAALKRTYSTKRVEKLFPKSSAPGIKKHLKHVLTALHEADLDDDLMVIMALATIRAETAGFVPIPEGKSKYNTSPKGHPFNRYDKRKDLGNKGAPDGDRFKGRGFVQLTGRANYRSIGKDIGLGKKLENDPDLGCDPKTAAMILAAFLGSKERKIKEALLAGDLAGARRLVNGGSHGLKAFSACYDKGVREFIG